jgi:hypothetical protein
MERSHAPGGARKGSGSPAAWRRSLLLFLLCLTVYNANLRCLGSYDSLAASFLPSGIWRGDGFSLDRYAPNVPAPLRYSMYLSRRGHWISLYPIVTPLLVTPLYLPTALFPQLRPDHPRYGEWTRVLMEKGSASIVAALSVLFVFWTLRRLTTERAAFGLALVYAFGTSTWVIASQALWQHGPAELLLAVSLYLLSDPRPAGGRAALLGTTAGLLAANRPHDLFFSLAIAWIVGRRSGRRAWPFLLASGTLGLLLVLYNRWYFPTVLGGYVEYRQPNGQPLPVHLPSPAELAGLLVSNRGLLPFCPFLLALVARWPRETPGAPPGREREETAVFGAAWMATLLFHACFSTWTGGYCYGPRYLTDGLPLLFVLLASSWGQLGRAGRALFAAAVLYSVALQAIGACCYPGGDSGNEARGVWDVAHSGPVLAYQAGLQSPFFVPLVARPLMTGQLMGPGDVRAEVAWAAPVPREWRADGVRDVRLRLVNRSSRFWSSLGGWFARDAVRWVVRWQPVGRPPGAGRVEGDAWLAWRLRPGATNERTITVRAPTEPGEYILTIEPGQFDRIRYHLFSESGVAPAVARVRVVAAFKSGTIYSPAG